MSDSEIIEKIRKDMGSYCFSTCHSKCCRRVKLVVFNKERADSVSQGRNDVVAQNENGFYTIDISNNCPSLTSDMKCSIYGQWARPLLCHEYPIFEHGKLILVSSNCDFYREGNFIEILEKLDIDGFRIEII